ncbi:hypothetical protein [Coleofasciculus sp.]
MSRERADYELAEILAKLDLQYTFSKIWQVITDETAKFSWCRV